MATDISLEFSVATYERKHPTTGFWVFYCNTTKWRGHEWLAEGHETLWYKASTHHRFDMASGQRGVIRFAKRPGAIRSGRKPIEVGVYALVEVLGPCEFLPDPDRTFYAADTELPKAAWRVPLRIVANLLKAPVLVASLPDEERFQPIRIAQQTASVAITEDAYRYIEELSGFIAVPTSEDQLSGLPEKDLANSVEGLRKLEELGQQDPKRQKRLSVYIERGSIGRKIKKKLGGQCQFCQALGMPTVAFRKKDGEPYSEAHHVVPVSAMIPGSLGRANIIVLCANHHRQAHFGCVAPVDHGSHWIFTVEGTSFKIEKPVVG
jgi:5-methylcytosine-specific restriction endonuclease McrA